MSKRSLQDLLYCELRETYMPKRPRLTCQLDSCFKTPFYGFVDKRPTHCYVHREEGMFNVLGKHCQSDDLCLVTASFGSPGGKPQFCKVHKKPGMVNVVIRRCACCSKFASHGVLNVKPTHCNEHKDEGMVAKWATKYERLEVRSNHCAVCPVKAFFGNCVTGRKFCKAHMNPETDWRVTFCTRGKCTEVATHIHQETLEIFCVKHAGELEHVHQFAPPVHQQPVKNLLQIDDSLPPPFPELLL